MITPSERAPLVQVARDLALELKSPGASVGIKTRVPGGTSATETDGRRAVVGHLGSSAMKLEIWLDRFAGQSGPTFSAWFAGDRPTLESMAQRASVNLPEIRSFTQDDMTDEAPFSLKVHLAGSDFDQPYFEKHEDNETYFGIYSAASPGDDKSVKRFINDAVAFFTTVAASQKPEAAPANFGASEHYTRVENRTTVVTHLRRERSGFMATKCKERDGYKCQICTFDFKARYGQLGHAFAEAHHVIPLNKLESEVTTRLEDLITVCANCHRMLHRMEGAATDVAELRKIVDKILTSELPERDGVNRDGLV